MTLPPSSLREQWITVLHSSSTLNIWVCCYFRPDFSPIYAVKQNTLHWITLHAVILISSLKDRWLLPSRYDSAIFHPTRDQVPRSKRPTFWQRCVTVTGCPPVSVLQSNRMRENCSHIDGRVFIWPKHQTFTPFLYKCFNTYTVKQ